MRLNAQFCTFSTFVFILIIFLNTKTKNLEIKTIYLEPTTKIIRNDSQSMSMKHILYWNNGFNGVNYMYVGLGKDIFQGCEVKNCTTTNKHDFMPVEKFDAIIFYGPTLNLTLKDGSAIKAPEKRSIYQKYIYYSREAPIRFGVDRFSENFYNWTMNYRRESDIFAPYGLVKQQNTKYSPPAVETLKTKKLAAWFVSNCDAEIRNKYVKELQKYIPVDIYGKCGNLSCSKMKTYECLKTLEKEYLFYLSFENSMCKDYVSEKMFLVLRYNVIPVVLGYVDYNTIAPPNSVVNAGDFPNPKDLADYLLKLSNNTEEYLKYFEWKKSFIIEDSTKSVLCQICKKLHEPLEFSSYKNLREWTLGADNSVCSLTYPFK